MKILNHIFNLIWTFFAFTSVFILWYETWDVIIFCVYLFLSFLTLAIPLRYFQLSKNTHFYKKLGVRIAGHLVQDGTLINKIAKKGKQREKLPISARLAGLRNASIGYERFHLLCFFWFLFSATHGVVCQYYMLSAIILFSNILYNFYPILLQQYYRLRIVELEKWKSIQP